MLSFVKVWQLESFRGVSVAFKYLKKVLLRIEIIIRNYSNYKEQNIQIPLNSTVFVVRFQLDQISRSLSLLSNLISYCIN